VHAATAHKAPCRGRSPATRTTTLQHAYCTCSDAHIRLDNSPPQLTMQMLPTRTLEWFWSDVLLRSSAGRRRRQESQFCTWTLPAATAPTGRPTASTHSSTGRRCSSSGSSLVIVTAVAAAEIAATDSQATSAATTEAALQGPQRHRRQMKCRCRQRPRGCTLTSACGRTPTLTWVQRGTTTSTWQPRQVVSC
jgi:hypothetical protein